MVPDCPLEVPDNPEVPDWPACWVVVPKPVAPDLRVEPVPEAPVKVAPEPDWNPVPYW